MGKVLNVYRLWVERMGLCSVIVFWLCSGKHHLSYLQALCFITVCPWRLFCLPHVHGLFGFMILYYMYNLADITYLDTILSTLYIMIS
jgi:hypothetical protein